MRLRPVRNSRVPAARFVAWIGIVALSLVFVAGAAPHASAQSKGKGMNFGGIPGELLDDVVGKFSGTLQPGITQEMANDVLLRLVQEEHAAANPGPDWTGFMDAFRAFEELRAANQAVKDATASEAPAAVNRLMAAIDALGKLWKVGPVAAEFFSPEPPEKEGP